jgi:hypothetical protein
MKFAFEQIVFVRGIAARVLLAALALMSIPNSVFGETAANDPRKPGTLRMIQILDKAVRASNPIGKRYFTAERAALLELQLKQAPPEAKEELTYLLGNELLNSGQNLPAITLYSNQLRRIQSSANKGNEVNVTLNLALSYMRQAEQINCQTNHNSDSCILPIKDGGIHKWQDGSRNAIGVLTNFLQKFPENLPGRWLLNIASMTLGEYPDQVPAQWRIDPKVFASDYDIHRFTDVAGSAGLASNQLSGGAVVEDLDGDGLLDVMSSSIGLRDQLRFYHNNGDGTFADRTKEAGLIGLTGGLNMITTDFNNDGRIDVLVLRGAWMMDDGKFPNSLLKNNGDGSFEDVTESAGLLSFHPTQTAVAFDFDGDGWLDLFIGNEHSPGKQPHQSELYRNNHNGTFTEVARQSGLIVRSYVKGVVSGDFNNDGRPDLYISVMHGPNKLFLNRGPVAGSPAGKFQWNFDDVAGVAGVQKPENSFPAFAFDFDNDGLEDIFVSGYSITGVGDIAADYLGLPSKGERAKLYRNLGNGKFADVTSAMHLNKVLHSMGANFGDLDNDGWLDMYLGTGDPDLLTIAPNRMFRNAGGKVFQDVTTSGGFGNIQKGHGVSFADLDNDGDQDVYHDLGGAFSGDVYPNVLFENPGHGNHWLKLQLAGTKANRPGIGAKVKVTVHNAAGQRVIYKTLNNGGSFGCNPLRIEMGLGDAQSIPKVEIRWPGSGSFQTLTNLALDSFYRVQETNNAPEKVELKQFKFQKAGAAHEHHHGS